MWVESQLSMAGSEGDFLNAPNDPTDLSPPVGEESLLPHPQYQGRPGKCVRLIPGLLSIFAQGVRHRRYSDLDCDVQACSWLAPPLLDTAADILCNAIFRDSQVRPQLATEIVSELSIRSSMIVKRDSEYEPDEGNDGREGCRTDFLC
jgi:hypothetical protein